MPGSKRAASGRAHGTGDTLVHAFSDCSSGTREESGAHQTPDPLFQCSARTDKRLEHPAWTWPRPLPEQAICERPNRVRFDERGAAMIDGRQPGTPATPDG